MAERQPPPLDPPAPPQGERIVDLRDAQKKRDAQKPNGHDADHVELTESHFRALGHDHGTFFFLSRRSGQIVPLTARGLTSDGSLLELAPLDFWEGFFPKKGSFDKPAAVNALINACLARRVFDIGNVRGRGAWWDAGRAVLHLGDRLVVDDRDHAVSTFPSRFIYEEAASFGISLPAAITAAQARRFSALCEMLRWERPYMATILAGWCVIAPLCGALAWRPHIWICAPKGA